MESVLHWLCWNPVSSHSVFHFIQICGYLFYEWWKCYKKLNKLHRAKLTPRTPQRTSSVIKCIHQTQMRADYLPTPDAVKTFAAKFGYNIQFSSKTHVTVLWLSSNLFLCYSRQSVASTLHYHPFRANVVLWGIPNHQTYSTFRKPRIFHLLMSVSLLVLPYSLPNSAALKLQPPPINSQMQYINLNMNFYFKFLLCWLLQMYKNCTIKRGKARGCLFTQ